MQNIMVALLIMQSALKSPDLDLAMIPSITAAVGTAFPLCIALPFYLCWQRYTQKVGIIVNSHDMYRLCVIKTVIEN